MQNIFSLFYLLQVCFSDESIFSVEEETSQYVRRKEGEAFHPDCVKQTVKHPTSVMVWSVFSWYGCGRLYIVEGTMRHEQYIKVLKTRLIPQVREWFGQNEFIFMQDGAPCHKAKKVMEFFRENNVKVLDWPGNSPDMNPIENLWAITKKKIRKTNVTTKIGLL